MSTTFLSSIVAVLWQTVDESSPAYQAGRSMAIIFIAIVVIVAIVKLTQKSK